MWRYLRTSTSFWLVAGCLAVVGAAFVAALLEHGAKAWEHIGVAGYAAAAIGTIWAVIAALGWLIARLLRSPGSRAGLRRR
jgi:hypothetical protein